MLSKDDFNTPTYTYDYLYVGSSPLNLMDACAKGMFGYKVAMVDAHSNIGGAWKTGDFLGCAGIENGPHFFTKRKGYTRFLWDDLQIEMQKVPFPKYAINDNILVRDWQHLLPKALKSLISIFGWPFKAFIKERKFPVFESVKRLKKIKLIGSNIYFKGGSGQFINKLERLAKACGVEIYLSERVNDITFDTKKKTCSAETDKRRIACGKLVLTCHSVLKKVDIDGKGIDLQFQNAGRIQIHFTTDKPPEKEFYLIKFIKSQYHYLSNLSSLNGEFYQKEGSFYFVLTLVELGLQENISFDLEELRKNLVKLGLFSKDTSILEHEISCYPDFQMSEDAIKMLRSKSGGMVTIFDNPDITIFLQNMVKQWKSCGFNKRAISERISRAVSAIISSIAPWYYEAMAWLAL